MPCPTTSPTTRATRPPDSGITSNQSPPMPAAGTGGQIAVGHLDGRLSGQAPGQQAVLEGQRGGALAGEAAGVVDADGGPAGEFLGEDGVVLAVVVRSCCCGRRPRRRAWCRGPAAAPPSSSGRPRGAAGPPAARALRSATQRVKSGSPRLARASPGLPGRPRRRRERRVEVDPAQVHGGLRGALGAGAVGDPAQGDVRAGQGTAAPPLRRTQSSRSTLAKSANRGTTSPISSSAVRDHVQGGADGGGRLVQQGQPLPRPVLVGAVERGERGADQLAGGVPYRPHLDGPGVVPVQCRGACEALVAERPARLGDLAQMPQEAPACAAASATVSGKWRPTRTSSGTPMTWHAASLSRR